MFSYADTRGVYIHFQVSAVAFAASVVWFVTKSGMRRHSSAVLIRMFACRPPGNFLGRRLLQPLLLTLPHSLDR